MQRLKTRAQYEAAMAGGTVSRTAHFVLHRALSSPQPGVPAKAKASVVSAQAGVPVGSATAGVSVVSAKGGTQGCLDAQALHSRLGGNDDESRLRGNGEVLGRHDDELRPRGNEREVSIGAVVPKRWARRAVTRNGIKRQIYNVSAAFEAHLPAAAHVVRLRTDFPRAQFPSAWSEALKAVVRGELTQLFERARVVVHAKAGRSP